MENKFSKADRQIDAGVLQWREGPYPAPPSGFLDRLVESPTRKVHPTRRLRLAGAFSLVAVASLTALVALNPDRSARADLVRVLSASRLISNFTARYYQQEADGKLHLGLVDKVRGTSELMTFLSNGDEQLGIRNGVVTNYPQNEGYVFIDVDPRLNRVRHLSVDRLVSMNGNLSVRRTTDSNWHGQRVDVYRLESEFHDGRGVLRRSQSTLVVDPATDRPLELAGLVPGLEDRPSVVDYSYEPLSDRDLQVRIPKAVPVYNYVLQRKQIEEQVEHPIASTTVDDYTVDLCAVVLDHDNHLDVLTTGTEPPRTAQPGLAIDGLGGEPGIVMAENSPDEFHGRKVVTQYLALPKSSRLPVPFTVRVPICRGGAVLGTASFRVHRVLRTGSESMLLRPMNLSIFRRDGHS